jgi:hypothetical protein
MPDHRGPKVGRLSDLVRRGDYLSATCERRECQHCGEIDPAALIERFGDVAVEAVNQAIICSKCGGREVHMQCLCRFRRSRPGVPI